MILLVVCIVVLIIILGITNLHKHFLLLIVDGNSSFPSTSGPSRPASV